MSWRRFFSRASRDRERAEEMAAHVAHLTDDLMARGVPADEARRQALVKFGSARAKREEVDDMYRLPILDVIGRDLRYAIRVLRRSPAFTMTAILTLAVVIGANAAVFSLADAVLVRPLPYPHPERLGYVVTNTHSPKGDDVDDSQDGASWETLRDRATAVDVAMTASSFGNGVNLVVGDAATRVSQSRVSAGFFRVLGVAPIAGREFTRDEDRPGGPAVAVISHDLWQHVFQGEPISAIGKTIILRGESYEVVGILPATFQNPSKPADVFTPARPSTTGEGEGTNYAIFARVRDGHTWTEASAEMAGLGNAAFSARPHKDDVTTTWALIPLQQELINNARQPIEMLAAAVGTVLLIACVNLAALLLARGGGRAKEIATRMALGSGRGAVIRQLMVESAVLGLAGGAVGLAIGYLGLDGLKALGGDTFHEWRGVTLDARALGATAGLALITSVIFGFVPALQASRLDVNRALTDGGSRSIAGGSRQWPRRLLVAAEVALGVVLLVMAGLLLRTFVDLQRLTPGFDATNVTTASVSLNDARYQSATKINQLFDRSLEALRRTPGIESAAVSLELPYQRLLNSGFQFADETDGHIANFTYVTPTFFSTLRIPVREGRSFDEHDQTGSPRVVIVNETFVRSWGQGANVIGRRIKGKPTDREIVGVVGDVQFSSSGINFPGMIAGPVMTTPLVFFPTSQTSDGFFTGVHTWFSPAWSVRASPAVDVGDAIRRAIGAVDPLLPVGDVRSMAVVQAAATGEQRLLMILVCTLAGAAILLAAVGIHGLIAHSIAERTREFGIRMALGATMRQMVVNVAASGVAMACIGAAAGGALSVAAVRLVASFLWGVGTHDPITYLGVAAFLLVIATISSVLPALRILRLDPVKTLRE